VPAPAIAGPARTPGGAVAFLKANVAALVLAVLLVGAIVWGVLGAVSANEWESRAAALSAGLATAEESLAEAEASIEDLETAKKRAESTATACIGAIDDADAMLEVSEKLDEKTLTYVEGLNDFIAAVTVGNVEAAEAVGTEMDKLTVQIEDLTKEIEGHIDDYGDSAEGCHVDDAQDA
jgi:F0F1-type ATP synthase membrane subunit b/b'